MTARNRTNSKTTGASQSSALHSSPQKAQTSSLLNGEKLKQLYATMLKCRMLKRRLPGLAPSGGEATEAGAAFDLTEKDSVAPGPRSSILEFIKGADLRQIAYCLKTAESNLPQESPSVQIILATGMALARASSKQPAITLAFANELAPDDREWKEAISLAARKKLAIIYVVQTPDKKDVTAGEFRARAQGCGLPAITVDGNDVVAVYRVMQECMRRARQGHGPAVIECNIGRSDPLLTMQSYLKQRNLWSDQRHQRIEKAFSRELSRNATRS